MTNLVKCNGCGKVQEAGRGVHGNPVNPIDDVTGEKWYSRISGDVEQHACSRACIKEGFVWPV